MEVLAVAGVVIGLLIFGWLWTTFMTAVESKAGDLTDRAVYGEQRRAAHDLGAAMLRIRTSVPSDKVWHELAFRLSLPSSRPRYEESLYVAGELPSTQPGNRAMRVDWNEDIQSVVVVCREDDGSTVCEHAMLQWVDRGRAMRNAVPHFQSLRESLVAIVRSLDPYARASLVDEDDHEFPFTVAQTHYGGPNLRR